MLSTSAPHKSIIDSLVRKNFHWARALDTYGISFSYFKNHTLEAACYAAGVSTRSICDKFSTLASQPTIGLEALHSYPVGLIIRYLKHQHHGYIKDQLPFIRKTIEQLQASSQDDADLVTDLKFVFPLFLEDFIHHIYEEEDNLFSYILALDHSYRNQSYSGRAFLAMEEQSIQQHALEHSEDDDEMRGIRGILSQYKVDEIGCIQLKVIFEELINFDLELEKHAKIENEILFPKALNLEKKVKVLFSNKIKYN